MDTFGALVAIEQGYKPDQATLLRLRDEGLIELTHFLRRPSGEIDYLPGALTSKGLLLLGIDTESPAVDPKEQNLEQESDIETTRKRWDVFISHASEDKEEIAHPLAEALIKRGYAVWYDRFSLKLGDSLRESIDRGLAQSRFGLVVLSKHFFAKRWPNKELNGLTAMEMRGQKVILPVWHGVTFEDIVRYSPMLADLKAVSTREGHDSVVEAIDKVLQPPKNYLQEFLCPHCGAPLVERSIVELDQFNERSLDVFDCGYSIIDDKIDRMCPSDPKFPRLEEYNLVYRENKWDTVQKWQCFARGKTKESQCVKLDSGLGRTKDEARQQVEDSYKRFASPWKS